MKNYLPLLFSLVFFTQLGKAQTPCQTIFISEYVEGWSNNKAIELYNPTDQPVNLEDYRLDRYRNGQSTADVINKLPLSGIMPPLSVYVIVLDKRDPDGEGNEAPVWEELQAKADTFACPVYNENRVMYFNGNDAMVLVNDASGGQGFTWDVIGVIGQDPGESGSGPDGEG
jgi:predicted extracellular nuclease